MDVCRSLRCDGLDNREPGNGPCRLLTRRAEEVLDGIEMDRSNVEVEEVLNNALREMVKQDKRQWNAAERRLGREPSPQHPMPAVKADT